MKTFIITCVIMALGIGIAQIFSFSYEWLRATDNEWMVSVVFYSSMFGCISYFVSQMGKKL